MRVHYYSSNRGASRPGPTIRFKIFSKSLPEKAFRYDICSGTGVIMEISGVDVEYRVTNLT